MPSEYMFGAGPGYLSRRVDRAARREGAYLVNYTAPGCSCGYGCNSNRCPAQRRHWFCCPNTGNGEQHARQVMRALESRGLLPTTAEVRS